QAPGPGVEGPHGRGGRRHPRGAAPGRRAGPRPAAAPAGPSDPLRRRSHPEHLRLSERMTAMANTDGEHPFPTPAAAPDRNLALELVRVTEAAALAAARWIGKGQKESADQAAVDAMRLMP